MKDQPTVRQLLTEALGIEYKPSEIDDALRWALAELYVRRAATAQQDGEMALRLLKIEAAFKKRKEFESVAL